MSYISAAIANLGFAAPTAVSTVPAARLVPAPDRRPEPTRDCPEVLRSLSLLRHTHAAISLFRIQVDGPAAGEVRPLLRSLLADDGVVERLEDGSYVFLVMRFDEDGEAITRRLTETLRVCLHRQAARLQATARLVAIHRSANLIGDGVDLVGELADYPPTFV
jgi:hypothetical protein